MQFREPVEKRMYAPGGMSFAFVSLNLSGSNFNGSGKYFGFMFISGRETRIPVPLGIFRPSSENQYFTFYSLDLLKNTSMQEET